MNALKVDTEKIIVKAAHEVFIEKGLDGARMQEIADRAGINKALLHYYFRSKDQLFDAVFQGIVKEAIPTFSEKMKEDMDMKELIETFVGFYNDFLRKNPYLAQFFFHEIWQHPDKLALFIKSQNVDFKEIKNKFKERIPGSANAEFFAQHVIANILGMTIFPHIARPIFQRILFDNNEKTYDKFLSERTDFLLNMMTDVDLSQGVEFGDNPDDDF